MGLTAEQEGGAGLRVHDGPDLVAEISALHLVHAVFRPGGSPLITGEVPLPLFWMQYADHEDPERNAGSNAKLRIMEAAPDRITVECTGTTASEACASVVQLSITRSDHPVRYRYAVHARLEVVAGWTVTPNPDHGEIEFANLWPGGTFVKTPGERKLYQSCLLAGRSGTFRIPHHHLESSDKHNIPLLPGEKFLWGVEDENPCLLLESGERVTAGVCAYMWDAHFAFKVTRGGATVVLPRGTHFEAGYALFGIDRAEAESLAGGARDRPSESPGPVYVDGVNTFSELPGAAAGTPADVWPWEREGSGELSVDRTRGLDDSASLHIRGSGAGRSLWKATAFGPAFGKGSFPRAGRYRLTAWVKGQSLAGNATIALRLHREGTPGTFQPETYELFASSRSVRGTGDWEHLEAVTPSISPPPDRLHVLLIQEGGGESWFDNVLFEVIS